MQYKEMIRDIDISKYLKAMKKIKKRLEDGDNEETLLNVPNEFKFIIASNILVAHMIKKYSGE